MKIVAAEGGLAGQKDIYNRCAKTINYNL